MSDQACCAHSTVKHKTVDFPDGSATSIWVCPDCGMQFKLEPMLDWAHLERIHKVMEEQALDTIDLYALVVGKKMTNGELLTMLRNERIAVPASFVKYASDPCDFDPVIVDYTDGSGAKYYTGRKSPEICLAEEQFTWWRRAWWRIRFFFLRPKRYIFDETQRTPPAYKDRGDI